VAWHSGADGGFIKCDTYLLVLLEAFYEGFCCGWGKLLVNTWFKDLPRKVEIFWRVSATRSKGDRPLAALQSVQSHPKIFEKPK
jgi:hypothetical protein